MFGSLTVKQEGGGAFLQCGDGGVEGLGSEHDAQRRVLDVDGGDDGGGHAGGVAGCLGGVGVEQLLEGAGGRAGVVGKCIGDLGAAVTEFGSGAAGLDDGDADTERGELLGDGFGGPFDAPLGGVVHRVAGEGDLASVARHLDDVAQYRRCACAVERRG